MSRPHRPGHCRFRLTRSSAVATTLLLAASGGMLGGSPVAAAAPTTTPTVPVMIVLDASGSMNQDDAPGLRIDAAKNAVNNLIDGLPAETQVGLQVYGTGTGSTDAEKAAGCTDIKTLAPVGPLDAAGLKGQVAGVVAAGYTPIGNALRAAADALPNEGPRSIVLVSDGEDTCAPPAPCDVAKELEQQGVDLTVHTVGFKVDPAARDQLSCIADSTGGTYSDAGNATELTDALATKVDYAITGYTPLGTPVTGADQPSLQAPLLTPGQYLDTLAEAGASSSADGTTKYYTIPVQLGDRMYVSATIIPPGTGDSDINAFGTEIDVLAADLSSCSSFAERGFIVTSGDRNEAVTTVLAREIGGEGYPRACPQQGALIVKIQRIGAAYAGQELPIEIVVRREPPADASAVAPAAEKQDGAAAPTHGSNPVTIAGGASFNDAPEITSGTTYTDTIVTGENRYFRIPLQWGQRFTYLLTPTGPAQPALFPGAIAWMDVFNPVRDGVAMTRFDTSGEIWFTDDAPNPFTASTPYPVRYTNREVGDSRGFSLDGDYYLRLSANLSDEEPSTTGYLLTVVVSGDPEPGPVYQPSGSIPTSGSATSTTPSTTSSNATPSSASVTSSTPSSTTVVAISGTGESTNSSVNGLLWAALGAGVVLIIGVCGWLITRRRRPANSQPESHR